MFVLECRDEQYQSIEERCNSGFRVVTARLRFQFGRIPVVDVTTVINHVQLAYDFIFIQNNRFGGSNVTDHRI
jgi:hypothetical protein